MPRSRDLSLIDMEENIWSKGKWIDKKGDIYEVSKVSDSHLMGIAYHLVNHAISSLHYDYFMRRNPSLLEKYKEDFSSLVLLKLSFHPVWTFVEGEIKKRNLHLFIS